MSANPFEARELLRRHLARRHPRQSWWSRFLIRRMTLATLAQLHAWEHVEFYYTVGHSVTDLSDEPNE